jgi:FMN reductase
MLALDYAVRPVLSSLNPKHVLPSIYATEAQVVWSEEQGLQLDAPIAARVDEGVAQLSESLLALHKAAPEEFREVPFSQVRCSV